MDDKILIRLNKYLSECGQCSRREADDLIARGEVTVDGHTASMGERVSGHEKILIHGKPIKGPSKSHTYIVMNKPRGVVCTTKNDKNNVIDYLGLEQRVFPVGRLDKDSEGLLILTSDGDIVNRMMRAGNFHEKEYVVTVDKPIDETFIRKMSAGVFLPELEVKTRPCTVIKTGRTSFKIILTQGLNRQIRRMCQCLGFRVVSLKRVRIMNIRLGSLATGAWRPMTAEELKDLKKIIRKSSNDTVKNIRKK